MSESRVLRGKRQSCCGVCLRERLAVTTYEMSPSQKLAKRCKKFGISIVAYLHLLQFQKNACAVCRLSDWQPKGPVIDHCHETGKVRGILCGHCNTALGSFKDEPSVVKRAAAYLEGGI